jgi:competence protein ComEC
MTGKHPLLAPAVTFATGSALGAAGVLYPVGVALLLPLALLPRLLPLAALSAGWLAAAAARSEPAAPPSGIVEVTATVVSVPSPLGERSRYLAAAEPWGRLQVTGAEPEWPLALGDRIRMRARLRTPPGPRNPGGWDTAGRLLALGAPLQAIAEGPAVRVEPPSPFAWLERARRRWAEAADALPAREAGILRAIGSGDRGGLDRETASAFARSGLAHLLAVSGLHLVVVAWGLHRLVLAAALRIERIAGRTDARRVAAWITLPAAFLYSIATGNGPPVLRAAVGAGAALVALLVRRELDALGALAIAALAVLALEPGAILDPSLQLSFAAVAGLALWARPLRAALPWPRPTPGTWRARLVEPFVEGGCVSLAASIATAPILAFHFRQVPLLGLAANVAAVPIGSALTALGAVGALASAVAVPLAVPILWGSFPLAWALAWLAERSSAPAWGSIPLARPLPAALVLFAAAAALATRARGRLRAGAIAVAAGSLLLSGPLRASAAAWRAGLEVLYLDVGQGDCALLRLPDGAAVLVDAGGAPEGGIDPGERDVLPLLRDLGVRRLDAFFLSHPHPDHLLGLRAVAAALPIERLFTNGRARADQLPGGLPPPDALSPGERWERAGVRFDVLGGAREGLGENDASLVLRVSYGSTSFLFPGDVEAAGEEGAVAVGGLRSDVVKVPHHGSRTSSGHAFVEAVGARRAVVTYAPWNRHGFPHEEAVARWRAAGVEWLPTAAGAVRLLSDGAAIRRLPAAPILDPIAVAGERALARPLAPERSP